jgi:hypothetical protein
VSFGVSLFLFSFFVLLLDLVGLGKRRRRRTEEGKEERKW